MRIKSCELALIALSTSALLWMSSHTIWNKLKSTIKTYRLERAVLSQKEHLSLSRLFHNIYTAEVFHGVGSRHTDAPTDCVPAYEKKVPTSTTVFS